MCGIFGHFHPGGADPQLVERMARRLAHRGPDGDAIYHEGPLAFGAGRLAIIDLNAPAGPLFNEDKTIGVAFNGEIYGYRPLREELMARGHRFQTATDTEVIVHAYEAWGLDCFERLDGMFAFCLWDAPRRRLLLARDRLGEKPLVYAHRPDTGALVFASEIKALLEAPDIPRRVDEDALLAYLGLGYVPPPRTMFADVRKLAPGEYLLLENGERHAGRYWSLPTARPQFDGSYAEARHLLRQQLVTSIESRMVSDVPVGAFLSGGVDSTAVVALMQNAINRPLRTFTVAFDFDEGGHGDQKFNVDARYAALAAQAIGTEHHRITLQNAYLPDLLPHLVYQLDEPNAEQAIIQTAYVAALARQTGVPVLLTGDAGDESFLGYTHYRADRLLERYLRVPGPLRESVLNPLLARSPIAGERLRNLVHKARHDAVPYRRYLAWMRMLDWAHFPALLRDEALAARAPGALDALLTPLLNAPDVRHFAERIAYTSLNLWIPEDSNMRVDKMTMLMSVEARAPLEDHRLVALALSLPLAYKLRGGDFKAIFKDAVRDLVPDQILQRPKWGFMPPASDWLRTCLRPLVERVLAPQRVAAAGYFRPEAVSELITRHIERHEYHLKPLWTLLVFHLWHAHYIEGEPPAGTLSAADLVDQTRVTQA